MAAAAGGAGTPGHRARPPRAGRGEAGSGRSEAGGAGPEERGHPAAAARWELLCPARRPVRALQSRGVRLIVYLVLEFTESRRVEEISEIIECYL